MASGRPDWYSSVAMHGKFAEEGEDDQYVTVAVDNLGKMLALMTGKLGDVYTPVAVDDQGIMRANLVLQDLKRMVVTTSLGNFAETNLGHAFASNGSYALPTITGKGTIIGGWLSHLTFPDIHNACGMKMAVDGVDTQQQSYFALKSYGIGQEWGRIVRLSKYDDTGCHYVINFNPYITFDDTLIITLYETNPAGGTFTGRLYHSLIV